MTAARNLLHKSKVPAFTAWLDTQAVPHRPGRGDYEILQVLRPDGQWFKLYRRANMPEHVTVQGPLVALVRQFIGETAATAEPEELATYGPVAMTTDAAPPWE